MTKPRRRRGMTAAASGLSRPQLSGAVAQFRRGTRGRGGDRRLQRGHGPMAKLWAPRTRRTSGAFSRPPLSTLNRTSPAQSPQIHPEPHSVGPDPSRTWARARSPSVHKLAWACGAHTRARARASSAMLGAGAPRRRAPALCQAARARADVRTCGMRARAEGGLRAKRAAREAGGARARASLPPAGWRRAKRAGRRSRFGRRVRAGGRAGTWVFRYWNVSGCCTTSPRCKCACIWSQVPE